LDELITTAASRVSRQTTHFLPDAVVSELQMTARPSNSYSIPERCGSTALLATCFILLFAPPEAVAGDDASDFFERRIRPLFLDKCIECHGPSKQENEIRLDRRNAVLTGKAGDVSLIDPQAPEKSRLLQVLAHAADDTKMPPTGKLEDSQIADVRQWIADGAIWPETSDLEGEARRRLERWREHWAFQPPTQPDLTSKPESETVVDFFIRRKLETKGLTRSEPADAHILVRRLSFALTGLPPQQGDLDAAALAVGSGGWDNWKSEYIDRLLASEQFGERWGRYWLDVARYADTKGYMFTEDREYPDAWRFREWVIRSLNSDMPYDEFLKRQLAADRLPGSDDPAQLAAMGYLTLGRRFLNNPHDIIDDRIDVVTRGMLGLTATCARCHDHKFDPIPTADYYALYGIFASSEEPKNEPSPLRMVDRAQPVNPVIFLRGSPGNPGDAVPRRFLTALSKPDAADYKDGSGRLELANSIAERNNPLTGRVAVNRIWMHLFGRGLVDSPSDFGVRTDAPTHPELLDYLTLAFMDHNWSQKFLIREIVSSKTWQQQSDRRPDAESADPENRLLARMNRTRLDFESQRDAFLAVSGRLNLSIGGPSSDINTDADSGRRTIYARIDRQNLPGLFRTFDLASPDAHAAMRFQTTVPQQALFQLNSPFVMNRSVDAAELTKLAGNTDDLTPRIRQMFQTILQREPELSEVTVAAGFIRQIQSEQTSAIGPAGWSYGYGSIDESRNAVDQFTVLPWSRDGKWQGGEEMPDAKLGWTSLETNGGHPGGTRELCAIRRWTTDSDCRVTTSAVLNHKKEEGDGVRLRIIAPHGLVVSDITASNTTAIAPADSFDLMAGESVDFVVDCRTDEAHDSFRSKILVTQAVGGKVRRVWNSEDDFRDQSGASRLDAWAQLAQTLMLTNEFVFVD